MVTNTLADKFVKRISLGLRRKAVTTCSAWALEYRHMSNPFPGLWTFNHHPWLRAMHDAECELWVGQKAAQVGYTETLLNKVFFEMDINQIDCLYALPTQKPDATDFSSSRFDPALEMSEHLSGMFNEVKNVGHKRARSANLYVRGSRARNALKSFPAGLIILDEIEEFVQANIPLALERASGQVEKQICMVSTPSVHKHGINKYFLETSREHFFFRCIHCNQFIELTFPDCLQIHGDDLHDPKVKQTILICSKCKKELPHATKTEWLKNGKWVPEITGRDSRGFYINQLYSATVKPADIAKAYFLSLVNLADEQELYNSKLGLAHEPKGARITEADIVKSIGDFTSKQHYRGNKIITMGVDVGKWLFVEIAEWTIASHAVTGDISTRATPRIIYQGKIEHFEQLDDLMIKFRVNGCVIDAHPERRKALEFSHRFYGAVKVCIYARGISGKTIKVSEDDDQMVLVDRTSWLDLSLGRFFTDKIQIPRDTPFEYKEHLKSLAKIYEKDSDGNPVAKYINTADDHYGHARNYAEIALPLAANVSGVQDMESPV